MSDCRHNFCSLLLAAGFGERLGALTANFPKCLMPVKGRPILDYWLEYVSRLASTKVFVNVHYKAQMVSEYLSKAQQFVTIDVLHEPVLLGTAGTIRSISNELLDGDLLVVHADNFCELNLKELTDFHFAQRPSGTAMTMVTFESDKPSDCGVVLVDAAGIVREFHEKVESPPSNLANAAIYMITEEVIQWIADNPSVTDFSTEVLPAFVGKIATWKYAGKLMDIGSPSNLFSAQTAPFGKSDMFVENEEWMDHYRANEIFKVVGKYCE